MWRNGAKYDQRSGPRRQQDAAFTQAAPKDGVTFKKLCISGRAGMHAIQGIQCPH